MRVKAQLIAFESNRIRRWVRQRRRGERRREGEEGGKERTRKTGREAVRAGWQ
jgi:hypothetical protein